MNTTFDKTNRVKLSVPEWPEFDSGWMAPIATVDGRRREADSAVNETASDGTRRSVYRFGDTLRLEIGFAAIEGGGWLLSGSLINPGDRPVVLKHLALLTPDAAADAPRFGGRPESVVMLVQSAYSADIIGLCDAPAVAVSPVGPVGEPNAVGATPPSRSLWSENVWMVYDRDRRQALLAGFRTNERFQGGISLTVSGEGVVTDWSIGFDGGDLVLPAGAAVPIEELMLLQGSDPFALLDAYAEAVQQRHQPRILDRPPVSWCSWYPYRLGLSAERMIETARIAARRLKPLGLTIIEADLGWEKDHLPGVFEPNERFPGGLAAVARELKEFGFDLGAWKGPFTISEFDPLVNEHPDWLVPDADGKPADFGRWFWVPHGKTHLLDLTHPEALNLLRERMDAMRAAGVRYFKADFIGMAGADAAKRRHDPGIVLGGGTQARRQAAAIMRDALDKDALLLNCGGPEMPGTGHWPLIYSAQDTGNTGFINWTFQRNNFRAIACHLWKNRRWGIIQPSCLCVGLPGTLEEARMRATMAFLSGGQIDLSDTLTTLGEDRWAVLEATLPPLGLTARPIDLFDPVMDTGGSDYAAVCSGTDDAPTGRPHPAGSVWRLHLQAPWDEWTLVAFFAMADPGGQPESIRFTVSRERLGLAPDAGYWAADFWGGQFLGTLPGGRRNANEYRHPGDLQDLLTGHDPNGLEIAFTGPGVKLLCLRRARPHPWVVAGGFHQSCGMELEAVRWNAAARELSGTLRRPAGLSGFLLLAGGDGAPLRAEAGGRPAGLTPAANGAWRLDLCAQSDETAWRVSYGS